MQVTNELKVYDVLTEAVPGFAISVSCSQVGNKIRAVVATIVSNYCRQLHRHNNNCNSCSLQMTSLPAI